MELEINVQSLILAGSPKSEVSEIMFRTSETIHPCASLIELVKILNSFFGQVKPSLC